MAASLILLLLESYSLSVLLCSIVMLMVMSVGMFVLVASWGRKKPPWPRWRSCKAWRWRDVVSGGLLGGFLTV